MYSEAKRIVKRVLEGITPENCGRDCRDGVEEQCTEEVERREECISKIKDRLELETHPYIKTWHPYLSKGHIEKNAKADKIGGCHPFFTEDDKEWPKCKVCSNDEENVYLYFLCQVSHPKNTAKYRNGVQIFCCPNCKYPGGVYTRCVDFSKKKKYIPCPANANVYMGRYIREWREFREPIEEWELQRLCEKTLKDYPKHFQIRITNIFRMFFIEDVLKKCGGTYYYLNTRHYIDFNIQWSKDGCTDDRLLFKMNRNTSTGKDINSVTLWVSKDFKSAVVVLSEPKEL